MLKPVEAAATIASAAIGVASKLMIYPPYRNSERLVRLSISKVRRFAEDLLSRVRQSQHVCLRRLFGSNFVCDISLRRYKVDDVTLFLESLEPFEIENRDAAIADAHEASRLQAP